METVPLKSINVIRASAAPWRMGVQIFMGNPEQRFRVKELVIERYEEAQPFVPNESALISMEEAQVLMDDLWQAGLRPSEGTGSAGSLKATENHLKDMRKIVFKSLGME